MVLIDKKHPVRGFGRTLVGLARQRSVLVTAALWLAGSVVAFPLAGGTVPFSRGHASTSVAGNVVGGLTGLLFVLLLVAVTVLLTRDRPRVDLAARAPAAPVARRETLALVAYGIVVSIGGVIVGQAFGPWAYSLHLPGTIYGLGGGHLRLSWVAGWMAYNFLFWAVLPFLFFRRRYSLEQLNLRSSNRARDLVLIVVVLVLESVAELTSISGDLFHLPAGGLLRGVPLAFTVNLFGTVLPVMVFIYAILLPRLARLTGSVATTAILGGVAYTLVHLFDWWTIYRSATTGTLTLIFLFLQYFAPGVIKAVLTQRTGNAWVHVWGYHAIAPHVTLDTSTLLTSIRS